MPPLEANKKCEEKVNTITTMQHGSYTCIDTANTSKTTHDQNVNSLVGVEGGGVGVEGAGDGSSGEDLRLHLEFASHSAELVSAVQVVRISILCCLFDFSSTGTCRRG